MAQVEGDLSLFDIFGSDKSATLAPSAKTLQGQIDPLRMLVWSAFFIALIGIWIAIAAAIDFLI